MTAIIRSLVGRAQTLDSVVLPAWGTQTRGGSTAALVAAVAAKTIQMDIVPDELESSEVKKTAVKTTPLTSTTYTVPDNCEVLHVVPAGTIAAHTINMPVNPYDGQELQMTFDQAITALTMAATGKTLKAPLTAAAAQGFATWRYNLADTTWYRVA